MGSHELVTAVLPFSRVTAGSLAEELLNLQGSSVCEQYVFMTDRLRCVYGMRQLIRHPAATTGIL